MSGFVNIKSAFLDKYPESAPASELKISFIGEGDILSVRDSKHPERTMVLAILNYGPKEEVKYNLEENSPGHKLICALCIKLKVLTATQVAMHLNLEFELCGTYRPGK
jgi:hypothetical protein